MKFRIFSVGTCTSRSGEAVSVIRFNRTSGFVRIVREHAKINIRHGHQSNPAPELFTCPRTCEAFDKSKRKLEKWINIRRMLHHIFKHVFVCLTLTLKQGPCLNGFLTLILLMFSYAFVTFLMFFVVFTLISLGQIKKITSRPWSNVTCFLLTSSSVCGPFKGLLT